MVYIFKFKIITFFMLDVTRIDDHGIDHDCFYHSQLLLSDNKTI